MAVVKQPPEAHKHYDGKGRGSRGVRSAVSRAPGLANVNLC